MNDFAVTLSAAELAVVLAALGQESLVGGDDLLAPAHAAGQLGPAQESLAGRGLLGADEAGEPVMAGPLLALVGACIRPASALLLAGGASGGATELRLYATPQLVVSYTHDGDCHRFEFVPTAAEAFALVTRPLQGLGPIPGPAHGGSSVWVAADALPDALTAFGPQRQWSVSLMRGLRSGFPPMTDLLWILDNGAACLAVRTDGSGWQAFEVGEIAGAQAVTLAEQLVQRLLQPTGWRVTPACGALATG